MFRYVIVYKDTSSISGEMRDITKQQTRVLRDLRTYTKYSISVYAENKRGVKGASAETEATTKGGGTWLSPHSLIQCSKLPYYMNCDTLILQISWFLKNLEKSVTKIRSREN